MRILLSSNHRYPALAKVGSGRQPRQFPSGSGYLIHDLIAKGLAELGHEVLYLLRNGSDEPLPSGLTLVSEVAPADILHTVAYHDNDIIQEWNGRPWVTTCHMDLRTRGKQRSPTTRNWIFVSRTLARLHDRDRYVLNGIDPKDYVYSESKDDYLLFMSTMDWKLAKGLDVALSLSKHTGIKLVIAGTGDTHESIERVVQMCREVDADYVGDVKGPVKARLLAGAKAFLFPTKIDEAFGLGMVEALMSGTPVICSDKGACPEIISPDVGFICKDWEDYLDAVNRIGEISPVACRNKAMNDYHYLRMARDYAQEYEKELTLGAG